MVHRNLLDLLLSMIDVDDFLMGGDLLIEAI